MLAPYVIWSVALYEARVLLRAWSFRIFSIVGMFILFFMNIGMATKVGEAPHFFNSLAGSLPKMNMKLLNVYQGVIAAFLASDFIKRDRKHDSTEVIYMRSMTNADYILGKSAGILFVFAILNGAVLTLGLFFHLLFSDAPFAWQPYAYYTLLMSLPTLIFMLGASSMLMNLIRSQAVVFVLLLGFSIGSLTFLGIRFFHILDLFAFHMPMMYSDFIGLGNLGDLITVRGAYFLMGVGLVGLSIVVMKRLPQSKAVNIAAALVSVMGITLAVVLSLNYLRGNYAARDYRERLREQGLSAVNVPVPSVDKCSIRLDHNGTTLDVTTELAIINDKAVDIDSLLFTLNPGLKVEHVGSDTGSLRYRQENHLLWIMPPERLPPGSSAFLTVACSGRIDERICYLDLADERLEQTYMLWLYSVAKRYAIVHPDYVLLTPEASWYPVPGLTDAASYPIPASHNFIDFRLEVVVDKGMVALSQGRVSVDTTAEGILYIFEPESRLPQMSLAVGRYVKRWIEVDSVTYSLYTLPGHKYFEPYFDQVTDTLPFLIRDLKNDYEMQIGFEYPYGQLSCVEVPIQFYCYDRAWTYAQEMVQPQIVLIPELGSICSGTDFAGMKRSSRRRQERANLAETPQETQAIYFSSFVKIDLLGIQSGMGGPREDEDVTIEPRFHILPNYVSYSVHLYSSEQPLVNYALESYIFTRATPPQDVRWRSWRGLTEMERANLLLRRKSLEDIIAGGYDTEITSIVMKEKGRYLFTLLEAYAGGVNFDHALDGFLREYRFEDAPVESFLVAFDGFVDVDLGALIESWYTDTVLPGYDIGDIGSYKVIDGERIRNQVRFAVSNPQPTDGVVTVGFRSGRSRDAFVPWWRRGSEEFDYERTVVIPALSKKEIGVILDEPPIEMSVETYISCNIPSVLRKGFEDLKLDKNAVPFDGEAPVSIDSISVQAADEYIVDNEDVGFEVVTVPEESRLRKMLQRLLGSDNEEDIPYEGLWFWRPPKVWTATTDSRFYGRFVHSGFYKASGNGSQKVAWNIDLDQAGMYDVSYYNPNIEEPGWMRRRGGGNVRDAGEYTFMVYHDDGAEEVVLDLAVAEEGWNLLGTYHLSPGTGRVELTDKNTRTIVTADAVKWVRR